MNGEPSRFEATLNLACAAMTMLFCGEITTSQREVLRPKTRRRHSSRKGRIVISTKMHHISLALAVDAGVASYAELADAMLPGGDPRIRVALRILQILPKYYVFNWYELRKIALDALRLCNGAGGAE